LEVGILRNGYSYEYSRAIFKSLQVGTVEVQRNILCREKEIGPTSNLLC